MNFRKIWVYGVSTYVLVMLLCIWKVYNNRVLIWSASLSYGIGITGQYFYILWSNGIRWQSMEGIIEAREKKRYQSQSPEIREQIDELWIGSFKKYKPQIMETNKIESRKGDIFLVQPKKDLYFIGVVVNTEIANVYGEDLKVIFILKNKLKTIHDSIPELELRDLLISPKIVDDKGWTEGYFYNLGKRIVIPESLSYGFFNVEKREFENEYGECMPKEPEIISDMGMSDMKDVFCHINYELILDKSLMEKE